MISYEGMKAESSSKAFEMLPAGPYVAQIRAVNIEGSAPNQQLVLRLDIIEGEHAGYFTQRFVHDSNGNGKYAPKYKGDYKLRIPHPQSNSQYPDSDKRRFNDALYRIEESNPGFRWDGNEQLLIGKIVGINMREGSYNDRPYTTIGRLEIADDVRKGLVKPMNPSKPRYSPDQAPAPTGGGFSDVSDTTEIPF